MNANGLSIRVAALYSSWFQEDGETDDGATQVEIEKVLRGAAPLPPGAIIQFDVEPLSERPLDLDNGDTIPMPLTIQVEVNGPAGLVVDSFTPNGSNAYEGDVSKIKPGRFQKSKGYSGLIVLDVRKTGPNTVKVVALGGGLRAELNFPWYAKDGHFGL